MSIFASNAVLIALLLRDLPIVEPDWNRYRYKILKREMDARESGETKRKITTQITPSFCREPRHDI